MPPKHLVLPLACLLTLTGCPTTTDAPTKPVREPRVADEWADMPHTADWLYATRGFSGKHVDECLEALKWVRGEKDCKGGSCLHARDLTREWQARCPKVVDAGSEVSHDDVEGLLEQYTRRAKEDLTGCGAEADAIAKNGCGKDKGCLTTAQRWATRCGGGESTPLVVRTVEVAVERRQPPDSGRVRLDPRSCAELATELGEASKCRDTFACGDALKKVTSYRDRCEVDGARPSALVASYEQAILGQAGQPTPALPVLTTAATVAPADAPTALADGRGMILSVCDQRVSGLDEYLTARRACQGGKLVFVGVVKEQGDPRARLGRLDVPSDGVLLARLPSMVAAGELELRDKQALVSLAPALDQVVTLAAKDPGAALAGLVTVLSANRGSLRRSDLVRKSLNLRDEGLAPVFKELGRRKQEATRKRLDRPSLLGLVTRSRERMLADVTAAGEVEVGGESPLGFLETADLLPRSTAALLDAMKGAVRSAATVRVDRRTGDLGKTYAGEQAQACADGFKALQSAQGGLVTCALGLEACDEGRMENLGKQSDEARAKIDAARTQLDLAVTGPGSPQRAELTEAATAAGCAQPWW